MVKDDKKINLGVFISGRGSNLKSIIDSIKSGYLDVNLAVVVSNKKGAPGLDYAKENNIPYHEIERGSQSIEEHDEAVIGAIEKYNLDLICLAGYMQIIQPNFIRKYKIMNIHPAILPSFPGLHGQKQALEYGVKIAGCTVHFIDEGIDTGPIIIQAAVPVLEDDTEETLSSRILEQEHIIYPKAVKLFSENKLRVDGRRVIIEGDLKISSTDDPVGTMKKIGVDDSGINNIKDKTVTKTILIENITTREALILKQEMLARGGDCAIPRECILNNSVITTVLLIGTVKQIKSLISGLKAQSFNLPKIAQKLEENIR